MSEIKPIRMKKRKMFVHVADTGYKVVLKGIIVVASPNEESSVRVGFTTTKKLGCAVIRNRIRRRLREVVRLSPKTLEMVGFDLVCIGRSMTATLPFSELQNEFQNACSQIQNQYKESL